MPKTILITGATNGIGRETARKLVERGHHVLLHGRNRTKLDEVERELTGLDSAGSVTSYVADLAHLAEVERLAQAVVGDHDHLDVLVNNAGVFGTSNPETPDGLDVRFAVNAIAPWLLTQRLQPLMGSEGRVINLSSAAQAPVDLAALAGSPRLSDGEAYAQSKLALTMWSRQLAQKLGDNGPAVIAVNPGSMLGTKMVKDAFGVAGGDIGIGADILVRAALDDEFGAASGRYFDNDAKAFADPHPDALEAALSGAVTQAIERIAIGALARG